MAKQSIAAAMALSVVMTAPANAAEFMFDSNAVGFPGYTQNYGDSLDFTVDGVTVTVTGWAIDRSNIINDGKLGIWSSGIGVKNSRLDNSHTVDNSGWSDFLVFEFSHSVVLDEVTLNTGWHGMRDTDVSVGYLSSSDGPLGNLDGAHRDTLNVLSLYEVGEIGRSGSVTRSINPENNAGQTWLIGASFNNPDRYSDGFKVESLTFSKAVPEPSTWMLMILGLGFAGGSLRLRRSRTDQRLRTALA